MAGILSVAGWNSAAQDADSVQIPGPPKPLKRTDPAWPPTPVMKDTQLVDKLKAAGANLSPPVLEIVRMSDAGTDPAVIQAFVENSPNFYNLRSAEIIYLHDHGIPNTIITAIIQRGTKMREQLAVAQVSTASQATQPPAVDASAYTAVQPAAPTYAARPSYAYSAYYPSYVYTEPTYCYPPYPSFGFYFSRPVYFGHSYGHSLGIGHRFSGRFGSAHSFGGRHWH